MTNKNTTRKLILRKSKIAAIGRVVTRRFLEREVWKSSLGPIKLNPVLPTARYRCEISSNEALLPQAQWREDGPPPTWYPLPRITASIMKDLIWWQKKLYLPKLFDKILSKIRFWLIFSFKSLCLLFAENGECQDCHPLCSSIAFNCDLAIVAQVCAQTCQLCPPDTGNLMQLL